MRATDIRAGCLKGNAYVGNFTLLHWGVRFLVVLLTFINYVRYESTFVKCVPLKPYNIPDICSVLMESQWTPETLCCPGAAQGFRGSTGISSEPSI